MTGQLALNLSVTAPRPCMWLEEWYGHPHCYLWQTFHVDCDACRERGRLQKERWEREELEKKARKR